MAENDLEAAFRFYKKEAGNKVAVRFLTEFERVAELLDHNPGLGSPVVGDRRSFPLRTYPYSVIYRPANTGIRILVVRHQSREPSHGAGRL